jgi:hypothetical protein
MLTASFYLLRIEAGLALFAEDAFSRSSNSFCLMAEGFGAMEMNHKPEMVLRTLPLTVGIAVLPLQRFDLLARIHLALKEEFLV